MKVIIDGKELEVNNDVKIIWDKEYPEDMIKKIVVLNLVPASKKYYEIDTQIHINYDINGPGYYPRMNRFLNDVYKTVLTPMVKYRGLGEAPIGTDLVFYKNKQI